MKEDSTPKAYIQLLRARVGNFRSIEPGDRDVPARPDSSHKMCALRRGPLGRDVRDDDLFENDDLALEPLHLSKKGRIHFYLRIRRSKKHQLMIASYSIAFVDLPHNPNNITSLRYDRSEGEPKGEGWDDDIGDNPQHPWGHFHVNFAAPGANDCRLPTGPVCPILIMCAFDHWYCSTFLS